MSTEDHPTCLNRYRLYFNKYPEKREVLSSWPRFAEEFPPSTFQDYLNVTRRYPHLLKGLVIRRDEFLPIGSFREYMKRYPDGSLDIYFRMIEDGEHPGLVANKLVDVCSDGPSLILRTVSLIDFEINDLTLEKMFSQDAINVLFYSGEDSDFFEYNTIEIEGKCEFSGSYREEYIVERALSGNESISFTYKIPYHYIDTEQLYDLLDDELSGILEIELVLFSDEDYDSDDGHYYYNTRLKSDDTQEKREMIRKTTLLDIESIIIKYDLESIVPGG